MAKLKSCPFCGSENTSIVDDLSAKQSGISCNQCKIEVFGSYKDIDVVRAWNTRHEEEA